MPTWMDGATLTVREAKEEVYRVVEESEQHLAVANDSSAKFESGVLQGQNVFHERNRISRLWQSCRREAGRISFDLLELEESHQSSRYHRNCLWTETQ